jgi:hypothetical protein
MTNIHKEAEITITITRKNGELIARSIIRDVINDEVDSDVLLIYPSHKMIAENILQNRVIETLEDRFCVKEALP